MGKAAASGTLVIADEAHHLGEELAWGEGFSKAFRAVARWLLLSGTLSRSDATPIPGVRYDRDGLAEPDVSYTYAERSRGDCRPVCFIAYDGTLSWRSGDDVIESSFETVLTAREASRRYRTAISTELPDGLPRILREADAKLKDVRAAGHRDAGGLVIAADSSHARRIAERCVRQRGAPRLSCSTRRRGPPRSSPRSRTRVTPGLSPSTWSPKESIFRGSASGCTRPRRRRRSCSGRSSDGSCARCPVGRSSQAGCTSRPTRSYGITPPRSRPS